jgi:hypothetical protein
MTTKLFITAMMMLTISTLSVNAQIATTDVKKADIQLTPNNQVRIWYLDANNEKVSFKVYNNEGETVMKKSYRCQGNMKLKLDMSKLQDGNYTIELISDKHPVCSEQINLVGGKIGFVPANKQYPNESLAKN